MMPRKQEAEADQIKVTLKQGTRLAGDRLVAALKRLVEIGRRLEKEENTNGRESDASSASDRHRDQAG
jgi:hypothetical protein